MRQSPNKHEATELKPSYLVGWGVAAPLCLLALLLMQPDSQKKAGESCSGPVTLMHHMSHLWLPPHVYTALSTWSGTSRPFDNRFSTWITDTELDIEYKWRILSYSSEIGQCHNNFDHVHIWCVLSYAKYWRALWRTLRKRKY